MNLNPIRIMMVGAVAMLCSVSLVAQREPGSLPETMPSNQPQPPQSQQTTMPSMQDSVGSSGDRTQAMKDKMFLRQAAEGGIAEVQLGQLAAQKSSSDDVKSFGQKMVDDHTALNKEIEDLADSVGVMLPKRMNKTSQAEYDKLNGLSGDAFDTEYLTFMVKDHHQDLREFRMESANTQDEALRDVVVKGQRVVHEHMVMAEKLAKSKGIEVPGRRGSKPVPPPME